MPKLNRFVIENDRVFMLVTPVKSLFQSGLIHDVITKGRQFAVDMNTGELTIVDMLVAKPPAKQVLEELTFVSPANARKRLSLDFETAIVQIADEYEYGVKAGHVEFKLSSNNFVSVIWRNKESFSSFINRVKEAYYKLFDHTHE